MIEFLTANWMPLLLGLMGLAKIIVNLTPTEKDNKIFAWVDGFIDFFIPNLDKNMKRHNKE